MHTPTLINLYLYDSFTWNGKRSNLTAQNFHVITNTAEMGKSMDYVISRVRSEYREDFNQYYSGNISQGTILDALARFQASLIDRPSDFVMYSDTLEREYLSEQEHKGRALFYGKARCANCHSGSAFTDNQFHRLNFLTPRPNAQGKFEYTIDGRDKFKFRTPSLHNVAQTAPYFHDGSSSTLRSVVDRYNNIDTNNQIRTLPFDDQLTQINLSEGEVNDLVAFLKSLSTGGADRSNARVNQLQPNPEIVNIYSSERLELLPGGVTIYARGIRLKMQPSGWLELVGADDSVLWRPPTRCSSNCKVIFQKDGNFVLYENNKPIWSTGTSGKGVRLRVANKVPYLAIMDKNHKIVWRYDQ